MDRHILIAVDGSPQALRAVRYVGRVFGQAPDFSATLTHLVKAPPEALLREARLDGRSLKNLQGLQAKAEARSWKILDQAVEELTRTGFGAERIKTRLIHLTTGLAKDLVSAAQNELFDALVLGRRGLGMIQEAFLGSVSQEALELARSVPVWLVDGQARGPRVLVALDGSEDSFRAVDHVGFILAGHPQAQVRLVHVSSALAEACDLEVGDELQDLMDAQAEDRCLKDYFRRARGMLVQAGLDPDRLETVFIPKSRNTARTILREAEEGDFGTVVVGRRGVSGLRGFFLGSVSNKIIQASQDRAVWVVA